MGRRHHGQPTTRCFRCGRDYPRGEEKRHFDKQCRPQNIPDRVLGTLQPPPEPKARRT